jgi:hypothetical protein
MTEPTSSGGEEPQTQTSLSTAAASNLSTTTKSTPQMEGTSPRWLLSMLPWVEAAGGVYRANCSLARAYEKPGQPGIAMSAGHVGEGRLTGGFVDYAISPREYELSVAQTVLQVHTRVADLFSQPMNQTEQQTRLTILALRERQEHELVNNGDFGLLHVADPKQRIPTRGGAPTPDDLDDLLCRRRGSRFFLAHPRAIAAFRQECNRRGVYAPGTTLNGQHVAAWRGVPMLPCDKIPITRAGTTSILVLRTGADDQGVIGLRQTGIPDEVEPGLSVRFTGIDEKAVISYLVTAYYSAAVLVPDALGVLEDVAIGRSAGARS